MLPFIYPTIIAQATATVAPIERRYITQLQEVRTLPGQLNDVLVFNSNSPEVIHSEGILLSTFPQSGKLSPKAHLNQPLQGRFDIFTHHIARPYNNKRPLYQGLLVHNPTSKPIMIRVLQAASYLNSTDAPFIELPSQVEDPVGRFYSGPGSRLMGDILRRRNQPQFPSYIVIPPQQSQMLFTLQIPNRSARSTLMRLDSSGPVYLANLAMSAIVEIPKTPKPKPQDRDRNITPSVLLRVPTIEEWKTVLIRGKLATPRDLVPTPPDRFGIDEKDKIYGRVAGISVGSEWFARVTDQPKTSHLTIPKTGKAFSYPLSTVTAATFGTRQVQSAPMLVRYPDTAYRAHGNYGVHYNLTFPLYNSSERSQTISVSLQTPFIDDRYSDRLLFVEPAQGQVFFRGTIRVAYRDSGSLSSVRYYHLVQRQGQQGESLLKIEIPARSVREVNLDFLYPPDATPPQVLTVQTLD
ncbi:hypothetical protein C7H19_08905 [Aphanothece hegewaldii CCALA 016]|uniref:DUF3370 domain-containing protein n=1 Tax=Aphanothece hegewaldii CCALA 016 TaxID=2107694 RepID=A0A2T1LZ46_9CHRO|nr:DUF3370 domain-containing protein [Aphanothece hegewaldii]PSF37663.1 hypothetical protein C7H19_08905 [Aphanothece hegewaldii CCALA 016]